MNLKKYDADLQWPDIAETWESLTTGVPKLLKGASIYIVGESTEINNSVAAVLADGIGYEYEPHPLFLAMFLLDRIDPAHLHRLSFRLMFKLNVP